MAGIRARGRLRVGFGSNIIPFSYFNARGELVGFDIAAAYRLARDLGVGLELVPLDWASLENDLLAGRFDIVMAGAYATPDRLRHLAVSNFYLVSPLALIVRSELAPQFLSRERIAARSDLSLAVFRDPVLVPLVHDLFPASTISTVGSYSELPHRPDLVGAIWTREQAAAWTSAHSGFTAVVPAGMGSPLPFAYLMPPSAADLLRYVNLWLELEQARGVRSAEFDYWVKGIARAPAGHRWNLIDNVLLPWWRNSV